MKNLHILILFTFTTQLCLSQDYFLWRQILSEPKFTSSSIKQFAYTKFDGNKISNCDQLDFIGGRGISGEDSLARKNIWNIPDHYKVKIMVTVLFHGTWDSENFYLKVDGQERARRNVYYRHNHKCGGLISTIEAEFYHHSDRFQIEFRTNLNSKSTDEAWAFRDIKIYLAKCEGNCEKVLDQFNGSTVSNSLSGWTLNRSKNWFRTCSGNNKIFSGNRDVNGIPRRTIKNLRPHYKVIMTFKLWLINDWEGGDDFRLKMKDGQGSFIIYEVKKDQLPIQTKCNSKQSKNDRVGYVQLELIHMYSNLVFEVVDDLDDSLGNESWGIEDLRVYILKDDSRSKIANKELFDQHSARSWVRGRGTINSKDLSNQYNRKVIGKLGKEHLYKRFYDLPTHTKVIFSFKIGFFGGWEDKDKVTIYIDDTPIFRFTQDDDKRTEHYYSYDGNRWKHVQVELEHFIPTLTVKIQSYQDGSTSNESWGVRELAVVYINEISSKNQLVLYDQHLERFNDIWLWSFKNVEMGSSAPITRCNGRDILGGFKKFGRGTEASIRVNSLPVHKYITIVFKVYLLDSWDDKEALYVTLDRFQRTYIDRDIRNRIPDEALCGTGKHKDRVSVYKFTFSHYKSNAKFTFSSNLNDDLDDESWGIRDIAVYVG